MKKFNLKIYTSLLSATTLCAILTGCGANDKVTTEEVESDLVQTEASENGEYSYLYDRLADEYGEFKIDVKEDGKIYSIVVSVDDEQIFDYELTYDEVSKVYTCDENIILSDIELVDGNVEYVTTTEVVEITDLEYDKKDVDTKDYGKRFTIEEIKAEDVDSRVDTSEIEDDETVYKVTYLDLEENIEEEVETEGTTEGMTTETVVDNEVETPDTPTNPSTPSNNGGSNNGGNNSSQQSNNDENSGNNGGGYTPAPTNPTPSTPTTETPSVPDTTETPITEEVHQHNWVEVEGTREVALGYDIHRCIYCGYETTSLDDCINHVSVCGGVWTHEEILALGHAEGSFAYNSSIGRPKGSNYTTIPQYTTETYVAGYTCSDCGAFKPVE